MMKSIRKNWAELKNSKKGFTLIEIIVVLIIIAILAAALIPSMLRFVEEAKGKAMVAEARTVYVAAQMVATENYAANPNVFGSGATATITGSMYDKIMQLAEADNTGASAVITVEGGGGTNPGKVSQVVYSRDGRTVTLNPGGSAVVTTT